MRLIGWLLLTTVWFACSALAQAPDPLLGYLISADETTWGTGGFLGDIRLNGLRFPPTQPANFEGRVSLGGCYSDYYRSRGMEAAGASFHRAICGRVDVSGNGILPWASRVTSSPQFNRVSYLISNHRQAITAFSDRWIHSIEGSVRWRFAAMGGGLGVEKGQRLEPKFGAVIDVKRFASAEVLWQRRYLDFNADVLWRDQSAAFRLRGQLDALQGRILLRPLTWLRTEARLGRQQYVRGHEQSLDITLEPWGDDFSYHGFAALDLYRWSLIAGLRGLNMDLMAYGMQYDWPYAKITRAELNLKSIFAAVEKRSTHGQGFLRGEVEYMDFEGYGRGHVEFWPFTSGLVELLGMRRYFIAELNGFYWRLHLAGEAPLSKDWSGGVGLNVVDAHIEAQLDHWRPEFLAFGKADEQILNLRLCRMMAGLAGFTVSWHPSRWEWSYSFQQAFPVKSWYRPVAGSPTAGQAQKKSPAYGGAFHTLALRWSF